MIPLYSDDHSPGGEAAEETDIIEGVDEDGNKVLLEVVRYFFYNGDEYVVLGEAQPESEDGESGGSCNRLHEDETEEEEAVNIYIMKVIETEEDGEEIEEFVPVEDDDLLEKLMDVVQENFNEEESIDE